VIVLGVDPGSRVSGVGVVRREGPQLHYVASAAIRLPTSAPLSERLARLHDQISDFIARYPPDTAAAEAVFQHRNARSALILGHARGVVLLACAQAQLEVTEYPPAQVKRSVGGVGNATKDQLRRMVELHLGRRFDGPADETDALAVAICHARQAGLQALAAAVEATR
jgi:crossover junction endodeoxyribonuclease RuvC